MQQRATCRNTTILCVSAVLAGQTVLFVPREAQALSLLDGVHAISESPSHSFIAGCAVGAVTCALFASVYVRRQRRRAEAAVDEALDAALRAELAADRARHDLQHYQELHERRSESRGGGVSRQVSADKVLTAVRAEDLRRRAPVQVPSNEAVPQASAPVGRHMKAEGSAATAQSITDRLGKSEAPKAAPSARRSASGQTVGDLLRKRIGQTLDLPVIERATPHDTLGQTQRIRIQATGGASQRPTGEASAQALRPAPESRQAAQRPMDTGTSEMHRPARVASQPERVFDADLRAAFIDRRVPRFDESLFPDTSAEQEQLGYTDPFAQALEAMDQRMPVRTSAGVDDMTSAHVEKLVKEELENNRRGEARRFSRSKLRMVEDDAQGGTAHERLATGLHGRLTSAKEA